MEEENVFEHFQEFIRRNGGSFNIINEQIDVDLQIEYFKRAAEIRKDLIKDQVMQNKDRLFEPIELTEKKDILAGLATFDDVECFRTIEKFVNAQPDESIKQWSLLAYNECKMKLESSLLEENQIFISTGLGGKDQKMRFFVVLFSVLSNASLNDFQQKLIREECQDKCEKYNADVEEVQFVDRYATILALVPFSHPVDGLFSEIINECNQYGNFMSKNFIITNVKKLTPAEIVDFTDKHKSEFDT